MQRQEIIVSSVAILDECEDTLDELETECCTPWRSRAMKRLRNTLGDARRTVESLNSAVSAAATIDKLASAGAQIGRLQVTCCAPARMPLYDSLLHNLAQLQLSLKNYAKLEH
jgi:hypothetical protein